MSAHDSYAQTASAAILDFQGRTVVYKKPNAGPVTTKATVWPEMREEIEGEGGRKLRRFRTVGVGGVEDPRTRDKVTIDGEEWSVSRVLSYRPNEGMTDLQVEIITRLSATPKGFLAPNV